MRTSTRGIGDKFYNIHVRIIGSPGVYKLPLAGNWLDVPPILPPGHRVHTRHYDQISYFTFSQISRWHQLTRLTAQCQRGRRMTLSNQMRPELSPTTQNGIIHFLIASHQARSVRIPHPLLPPQADLISIRLHKLVSSMSYLWQNPGQGPGSHSTKL